VSDTDQCARCGGDCPMTSCPECGGCENTGTQPCPACQPQGSDREMDPCDICANEREECHACDGTGDDGYDPWGCPACGGSGEVIPEHCCACGGSPYCNCCSKCGAPCSSVQAEPGLRSGGTGTLRAFARWGTSRNRAVWYWAATLPRLVRQGDPTGAAQDDIGQSLASTRRKSSSLTRKSFHVCVSPVHLFATTHETRLGLIGHCQVGCFIGGRL